jgi:glc operon protein GlcG
VVVDAAGDMIVGHRMDGSGPAYFEIARRKAATSALLRAPSKNIEDNVVKGLAGSGAFMGAIVLDDIMPRQGGLPVKHGDATIGGIGVSGATPDVDELIAQAGLNAIAG